jgi:FMN phosphatase YigB (HAD superfamily)
MTKSLNFQFFKVLTFDCYGTLIDWETGLRNAFQKSFGFNQDLANQALEKFGELETLHQKLKPRALYPQILEDVAKEIGLHFNKVHMFSLVFSSYRNGSFSL